MWAKIFSKVFGFFLILPQYLIGKYILLRLMPFSLAIKIDNRISICKNILKLFPVYFLPYIWFPWETGLNKKIDCKVFEPKSLEVTFWLGRFLLGITLWPNLFLQIEEQSLCQAKTAASGKYICFVWGKCEYLIC